MKQLTLEQALELVHPWLGTWQPGKCKSTDVTCRHFDQPWFDRDAPETQRWLKEGGELPPFAEHDIPMPPATDELAMRVLRRLRELKKSDEIEDVDLSLSPEHEFGASIFVDGEGWSPFGLADDPRDAIIIAAGTWLQSQQT